jgi:6-phosphogluconolactonase (cycloisomerase 2 family)
VFTGCPAFAGTEQNTDTIVPFKVSEADGTLTPAGQVIKTNSPCTIVFAGG